MYKEKLKFLREEKEVNQENISKKINVTQSVYCHYETEYNIIPLKHLVSLCDYLNSSLDYIFSFTNKRQYENTIPKIDKIKAGNRLKEFRKENKITQKKLSELLNTAQPVIAKYEKGINIIATPFLYTICTKYKVSADYLLGKIDYNPKLNI